MKAIVPILNRTALQKHLIENYDLDIDVEKPRFVRVTAYNSICNSVRIDETIFILKYCHSHMDGPNYHAVELGGPIIYTTQYDTDDKKYDAEITKNMFVKTITASATIYLTHEDQQDFKIEIADDLVTILPQTTGTYSKLGNFIRNLCAMGTQMNNLAFKQITNVDYMVKCL